MSVDVAAILAPFAGLWWTILAVFTRTGAAMALLPAFGEQSVPVHVRLALTVGFSIVAVPLVPAPAIENLSLLWPETVCGLALGIWFRFCVQALTIAGQIAAQATSLSQLFASAGGEPQPTLSTLLYMAGLVAALHAGLPLLVVEALTQSYRFWPAGGLPLASDMMTWGVGGVVQTFQISVSLSAPFVILAFLYNLALGVINRAMPQLMVAMVGAPALTLGGLVLMALCTPVLLSAWWDWALPRLIDPIGGL